MKALIVTFFFIFAFNPNAYSQNPPPKYLGDFTQDVLLKMLPKHDRPRNEDPYRLKLIEEDGVHIIRLEVLIPVAGKKRSEWNVFSKYQFIFIDDEEQKKEPASIRIHRFMNRGEYIGAAIEGQLVVNFHDGSLADQALLPGLVRSLFRADYTLHQMFKNPLLPEEKQVKKLTPPQIKALAGDKGSDIPGLITMYRDFKSEMQTHPMHAALMLPTGNGKSIVAIKYLEMVKMFHQGQTPRVLFLVENKIILADMVQKLQEQFPGARIATLFGRSTNMAIDPDTQFILSTRSTGFRRQDEILDFLASKSGPKVIYRDESQHTGKVGGQFSRMLVNIMNRLGSETQVIDMSATPWHDDAPDLIKQYQGRVATTFVTSDEYQKLIMGQQVDRIARLQLVRAILDGWLAPLDNLTFVTQGSEDETDDISFRARLLREQYEMLDRLGLDFNDETIVKLNELSDEDVSILKDEIKKVHEPIVAELLKDLRNQILRDRNGKVAEYDRGIIFVPSILHAEAYQFILSEMTGGNMEFRVVHSKQSRTNKYDVVEENIDWFNGTRDSYKHRYLISVDMLREGVDIPGVNRIVSVTTSESIKILLQMFGRATRLSPLKSGIRLTDFGGSFLKFFQEIPGSLLRTLFPLYESQFVDNSSFMSFEERTNSKGGIVIDGEAIDVNDLQFVQLSTPMQELAYVGDRDEAKVRRASLEILEDHISIFEQHEELYAWSLEAEEIESFEVSAWLNEWLDWTIYKEKSSDTGATRAGAYHASSAFDKEAYLMSLEVKYGSNNGDYEPLSNEDIESIVSFIHAAELEALSDEDKKNYQPTDHSQTQVIDLMKRALELASVKTGKSSYRGLVLGYGYSEELKKAFKELSPYALFSIYLYEKQTGVEDVKESNVYQFIIEQEEDRRYKFFKNRDAVFSFIGANWRWLSLPWNYLLDDINVERSFYTKHHNQGHPLEETYDKLVDSDGEYAESLRERGYFRVIDAIQDGYLDFLPSEIQEGLGEALEKEPDLIGKIVSMVNLYALVFSEEGQEKILSAPRGAEFINQYDKRPKFNQNSPYYWSSFRRLTDRSHRIWHEDYRWVLDSPRAREAFEGIDQSPQLAEIRQKSLSVGLPYSGVESRETLSLLRLLSLTKNLPYETADRSKLQAFFNHIRVENDRNLGQVKDGDRTQIVNGVFAPNRSWDNVTDRRGEAYVENHFTESEEALMFEALRVEASKRRLALAEYKGDNFVTKSAIEGSSLPPILLSDLLKSAKHLDQDEVENAFRLYMIRNRNDFSWTGQRREQKFELWDGNFSEGSVSLVGLHKTHETSLWLDHFERIVFNPSTYTLSSADQLEMAKIIGMVGEALANPEVGVNQSVVDSQDWLLSVLPNSDIPFGVDSLFEKRLGGVFKQARMFMALPYYYSIKHTGKASQFSGIGKHRNNLLVKWAPIFEQKYATELDKLGLDKYFNLPDDVFTYLHQVYINRAAVQNGSVAYAFKPYVKDLGEFDNEVKEQGDAIISASGINMDIKKRSLLDIEMFKKYFIKELIDYMFLDHRFRSRVTPWDSLQAYTLGLELIRVSNRIQTQRGSLQTYSLGQERAPLEVIEERDLETYDAGSCQGILTAL